MIKAVIFDLSGVLINLEGRGNFEIIEKNLQFAEGLKDRYKLGVLSNLSSEYAEKLKKERFYEIFDAISLSGETGFLKPDKNSYLSIIEKLAVCPEEAVFVDDSLENIKGAESLGMKTIFYRSPRDLKEENFLKK